MTRIDRDRLNAADLRIVTAIPIRYDDLDTIGHVNNAAAAVILQEARANFHAQVGFVTPPDGLNIIVAAIAMEFAGEMHFPGAAEVRTGVLKVGRTSYTLGQVARQDGQPTLYAETVLVIAGADGPEPIPDIMRTAYERLLIASG